MCPADGRGWRQGARGGLQPGSGQFLELLAREAAAVEFEGPLVATRAAGLPPDRLAELEQAKSVVLRVRALLDRRRRRESELSGLYDPVSDLAGLYDTVSDLAGLRDLDDVLRAIVHRDRHLLGCPLTERPDLSEPGCPPAPRRRPARAGTARPGLDSTAAPAGSALAR